MRCGIHSTGKPRDHVQARERQLPTRQLGDLAAQAAGLSGSHDCNAWGGRDRSAAIENRWWKGEIAQPFGVGRIDQGHDGGSELLCPVELTGRDGIGIADNSPNFRQDFLAEAEVLTVSRKEARSVSVPPEVEVQRQMTDNLAFELEGGVECDQEDAFFVRHRNASLLAMGSR